MKCNIGKTDRIIRSIIGGGLIGYALAVNCIIGGAIGGVLLLTAIISWCPPYALLKINTGCKTQENEGKSD